MNKFSDIIKKLREEHGYNQEALAEKLGVSKSTVAMWETDKRLPSKELYEQIADTFNLDIDFLYGRTSIRKARHFDHHGNEYINAEVVKEEQGYYFDDETARLAQEIFNDSDMRILFDLKRSTKAEDLMKYARYLNELRMKEEGEDQGGI